MKEEEPDGIYECSECEDIWEIKNKKYARLSKGPRAMHPCANHLIRLVPESKKVIFGDKVLAQYQEKITRITEHNSRLSEENRYLRNFILDAHRRINELSLVLNPTDDQSELPTQQTDAEWA